MRPNPKSRTGRISLRVSIKELNRILYLAKVYAEGNVNEWVVYGAINAPRRKLRPKRGKPAPHPRTLK